MKNVRVLEESLRKSLKDGFYKEGEYLPSLRSLASQHSVCPETARQVLNKLSKEGVLKNIPRKGFQLKVLRQNNAKQIAFVTDARHHLHDAQKATWACANAVLQMGEEKELPVLSLHLGGIPKHTIATQLQSLNLMGVILDSDEPRFVEEVLKAQLPTVMVNSWIDLQSNNCVVQDNYYGSYKAVKFLIDKGIKNIAWLGHENYSSHARERYAGYKDAMQDLKATFLLSNQIISKLELMPIKVSSRLQSKDRPEAILAFGESLAEIAYDAAKNNQLILGKEFEVVGWGPVEQMKNGFFSLFENTYQAPAVSWKASDMGLFAIERILSLDKNPNQPACRISIPTNIIERN
jgi:DNA-binding LacI/PurR family transcriptional regulator